PLGRTRTPKPGSLESQTANSLAHRFRPSATRLVIRRSATAAPCCPKFPLGKHRESTEKEVPGTSRKYGTPENPHYKGISGNTGNARKPRELAVLRMAFKRSGVRLPLAPPASGSASQSYRFGRTVVRAVACARTAVACSGNAFTNRSR